MDSIVACPVFAVRLDTFFVFMPFDMWHDLTGGIL